MAARILAGTMPDLRAAVRAELDRRGMSVYKLIQMLAGKRPDGTDVPPAPVYAFLREKNPSSLNTDDLGLLLDVLGIGLKLPKGEK